ncbi:MAG: hypothetical protein EBQ89_10490 [Alphaproteobacteria bacterium]|nr:hypothetical protein [Alphaproteobacteria bacterium]
MPVDHLLGAATMAQVMATHRPPCARNAEHFWADLSFLLYGPSAFCGARSCTPTPPAAPLPPPAGCAVVPHGA